MIALCIIMSRALWIIRKSFVNNNNPALVNTDALCWNWCKTVMCCPLIFCRVQYAISFTYAVAIIVSARRCTRVEVFAVWIAFPLCSAHCILGHNLAEDFAMKILCLNAGQRGCAKDFPGEAWHKLWTDFRRFFFERRLLSPLFVDILALENRRCFEDIVNKASPTDKSKKCAPPPKTDAHTWTCSSSCTEKLGELGFTERNYHSRSYLGREGVMSCFLTSRMIDHQLIKQKVSRLPTVCAFSCACLCDCLCVENIHFVPPLSFHSWMEVRTCTLIVIFPCLSHHNGGQVAAVTLLTTDRHTIFIKLLQNSDNKILSMLWQNCNLELMIPNSDLEQNIFNLLGEGCVCIPAVTYPRP